jgi:putative ABC transport system substrate-binding protein
VTHNRNQALGGAAEIAYGGGAKWGGGVQRRKFLVVLGCAAAALPKVGGAQQPGKTRRIGVLFALPENDRQSQARLGAFRVELQKLGWGDIAIDARYVAANDAETHQRYAQELVASQPDLILAQNTDATAALVHQTRTIPIIFTIVADPVVNGFVASFPHPGGNATGFVTGVPTMGEKWLELLREIAPKVTRVLVPYNTATVSADYYVDPLKASAARLGIEASAAVVQDIAELEKVLSAHASAPSGGLVVLPDAYLTAHRLEVTALAARFKLPTVYAYRFFADSGGLISYGPDLLDNFRRAAIYADRILRGDKVGELPVQAPEKFELVINLKAAKPLDLDVPPALLARADEVIE